MEIQFCDLCNESVPKADLDLGRAVQTGTRVICVACEQAMSGKPMDEGLPGGFKLGSLGGGLAGGPGPAKSGSERRIPGPAGTTGSGTVTIEQRGTGTGALVGLLAIVFAGAGFALLMDWLENVRDSADVTALELRGEMASLKDASQRSVSDLGGRFDEFTQVLSRREREAREQADARLEALAGQFETTSTRFEGLLEEVAMLREATRAKDGEFEAQLAGIADGIASVQEGQAFFENRMIELEENFRSLSSLPPSMGPAGDSSGIASAIPGGAAAAGRAPAWQIILPDLNHENPGIRLEAIYALGETRSAGVVPHLVPMLSDDDLFVRMATARILQDMKAREAVPVLIDTLEDDQSAVREAAMVALRDISGQNFRFEPLASEGDRTKQVKHWRAWWKKSGEAFLAGA